MAQRRMIHASLFDNKEFWYLSDKAKILYVGMIVFADDDGRLKGDSILIKRKIYPPHEDVKIEEVKKHIGELVKAKLIVYYKVEDEYFIQHPNWTKYQSLRQDRKKDSDLPPLEKGQPSDNQVTTKSRRKLSKDKITEGNTAKQVSRSSPKPRKSKEDRFKDPTPQSLGEFVELNRKSPQRHTQILAEYADQIKPKFTTVGQWESFRQRHVRDASKLVPYDDDQITEAFERLEKSMKTEKNPKGYITKWTLNTVLKFIE